MPKITVAEGPTNQAAANDPGLPEAVQRAYAAPASHDDLARAAYSAYGRSTHWFTHDGRDMPAWRDLGDRVRDAWLAVARELRGRILEPGGFREVQDGPGADAAEDRGAYPADGTVDDVRDWVGEDTDGRRARYALARENERETPRAGVLSALEKRDAEQDELDDTDGDDEVTDDKFHDDTDADSYPVGGTATDVERWVGTDPTRAREALDYESVRPTGARAGLSASLRRIAAQG